MCCDDEGPDYLAAEKAATKWIKRASRPARLELIAELARGHVLDPEPEDSQRRIETVLWVATGGESGHWHAKSSTPSDYLARARSR